MSHSPDLPLQTVWGYDGRSPGPTYVARYGEPILVRNFNDLPAENGGFGIPEVSTHLHNSHTPSESDGFPCDYFASGFWYDHHYPNVLADKRYDPNTGLLVFDLFNTTGFLGDKFLVNGKIQPFFEVKKRRYDANVRVQQGQRSCPSRCTRGVSVRLGSV